MYWLRVEQECFFFLSNWCLCLTKQESHVLVETHVLYSESMRVLRICFLMFSSLFRWYAVLACDHINVLHDKICSARLVRQQCTWWGSPSSLGEWHPIHFEGRQSIARKVGSNSSNRVWGFSSFVGHPLSAKSKTSREASKFGHPGIKRKCLQGFWLP